MLLTGLASFICPSLSSLKGDLSPEAATSFSQYNLSIPRYRSALETSTFYRASNLPLGRMPKDTTSKKAPATRPRAGARSPKKDHSTQRTSASAGFSKQRTSSRLSNGNSSSRTNGFQSLEEQDDRGLESNGGADSEPEAMIASEVAPPTGTFPKPQMGETLIVASDEGETSGTGSLMSGSEDLMCIIKRQKRQIQLKKIALARIKDEQKDLKERLAELEEELEEKQTTVETLKKSELQYRNWWLNEVQFTKVILNKVPNPNRDIELVRASQAHYVGHY
ncbi:hypothetical protein BKA70DRAFT_1432056 [Coprinopsis sp. MPI-PUGE-AT-0042]|nr:hypothetical protein BKA70DRAFT_1432056 [Coprinopsis sp. MPI-PUGE-AT-0042]